MQQSQPLNMRTLHKMDKISDGPP